MQRDGHSRRLSSVYHSEVKRMGKQRVLFVNERLKIGEGYLLHLNIPQLAKVLHGVGLTLEVEPQPNHDDRVVLYAARRSVTNEMQVDGVRTKPASLKAS